MKVTDNFLLLPNDTVSVAQILSEDGKSAEEISNLLSNTGISHLRVASTKSFSDFVLNGLEKLSLIHRDVFSNVDAVIVVSQSYDQRIPSLSTRIQKAFDLPKTTFCLDIMDGCAGYVKGLHLASMLQGNGCKKIMVVAGDLNSLMTTSSDMGAKVLFGDGVSISTLEADGDSSDAHILNDGDLTGVIACPYEGGVMRMDGFEVFRFAKNQVPMLVNSYLEERGEALHDYDLVAFHQASKLVVNVICASLKFRNQLCPDFNCAEIGNLGSASIGAWLTQIEDFPFNRDLQLLAVGFGSGLSWGVAPVTLCVSRNEVVYV